MTWLASALVAAALLAVGVLIPSGAAPATVGPCGLTTSAPVRYQHVIWILMENKSYNKVMGSRSAPYETSLARRCGSDSHWSDAGSAYNSLPNYIALTSGIRDPTKLNPFKCDCKPSSSVHVNADNIFRQVRAAGGTERSYEEGMSVNCGISGARYASKHNPAEYYWGGFDRAACKAHDVPMGSATSGAFVNALRMSTVPTFSFITPNLCHDTHDCGVSTGDNYLKTLLPQIFRSATYRARRTAVFVIWDENTPVPNLVIAPSVPAGLKSAAPVGHYSALRATEEMLGLPLLGAAAHATSLRSVFHF